jgi:Mg2+/Co2+ transporter CorB
VYLGRVQLSNLKILNNLSNFKSTVIKTSIFISLAAYWGVILVGTFITFS